MVYFGRIVRKISILGLVLLLFFSNFPAVLGATSPWSQSDWSAGNYLSSSGTTTGTANQVTLTKSEKLTNTGFESDLTGWSSKVTSFADSTFNGVSGAVAAWPFDDTTSTQSYARVVNPAVTTGRNIVLNGTFDTDTLWTKGTGWTIDTTAKNAVATTAAAGNVLTPITAILTVGKTYSITYDAVVTTGSVRVEAGTGATGTERTTSGTYTETLVDTTTTALRFNPVSTFTGTIDNIVVTQLNVPASNSTATQLLTDGDMEVSTTAAWSAGNSAQLSKVSGSAHGGNNVLRITYNNVASPYATQANTTTVGKTYRITGWMRGDGSTTSPKIILSGPGSNLVTGAVSSTWQPFDVVYVSKLASGALFVANGTGYADFDDVVMSEDNYVRSGELAVDGGLETWTDSTTLTNWTQSVAGTSTITRDTTTRPGSSGTYTVKLTIDSLNSAAGIYEKTVSPGKTYQVTFWAKADAASGGQVQVMDSTFVALSGAFNITDVYAQYSATVISTTAGGIGLKRSFSPNRTIYIDDISVTEVDPVVGRTINFDGGGNLLASKPTIGVASGGHLSTAYSFNPTHIDATHGDLVNIYSTDLNSVFSPSEGSLVAWAKVSGSSVWTDGVGRYVASLQADANNYVAIAKNGSNNKLSFYYNANGTLSRVDPSSSSTDWIQVVLTWSKSSNEVKAYVNGAQVGTTQTGLGTWVGNFTSTVVSIGSSGTSGSQTWSGLINDVRIYNTPLSGTQILALYNGLTATRDTSIKYSGSASSKLVGAPDENGIFTQSVNVGDTNQYNISALAYTDGSAVTSSDASLYYNGNTITTTYTSVGAGWYQLTGTVTGVASAVDAGLYIPAGKTVYVDDVNLYNYPSSGTLTSSIFDSGGSSNWGTLTYSVTTPTNTTATVKVRSGNNSDLSDATAFSSCNTISSGSTVGGTNCANNGTRYAQYLLTFTSSDLLNSPTFTSFSLPFNTSFTVNLVSPGNNSYTNNQRPTFAWNQNTTGGVAKYILEIDPPNQTPIVVDNIQPSRTTDVVTSKYTIHYDTNTISFYTTSSSNWGPSENDGKLPSGTTTWKVTAVDSYGNQTTATRTLNVDLTPPTFIHLSLSGTTISGTVSDNSGIDSVNIQIEKQNIFGNYDLYLAANLTNITSSFSFTPDGGLPAGVYKVLVTAKDKAGNTSPTQTLNLNIGGQAAISTPAPSVRTVPSASASPLPTTTSIPTPTTTPTTGFKISFPKISINFEPLINSYVNLSMNLRGLQTNVTNGAITFIGGVFNTVGTGVSSGYNALANLYSGYSRFVITFNNNIIAFVSDGFSNATLAFTEVENRVVNGMIILSGNISSFYKGSLTAGRLIASIESTSNDLIFKTISLKMSEGYSNLSYALVNGVNGVFNASRKVAMGVGGGISNFMNNTKLGISNLALGIGEKVEHVSGNLGQIFVSIGYGLQGEPTTIANVKVANISPTSVKISWKTNQLATGKVNYGLDRTYPFDAQSTQLSTNHEFTLTNLKPNTKYYFEIMSQGKNYVYDANREFVTLP